LERKERRWGERKVFEISSHLQEGQEGSARGRNYWLEKFMHFIPITKLL